LLVFGLSLAERLIAVLRQGLPLVAEAALTEVELSAEGKALAKH